MSRRDAKKANDFLAGPQRLPALQILSVNWQAFLRS